MVLSDIYQEIAGRAIGRHTKSRLLTVRYFHTRQKDTKERHVLMTWKREVRALTNDRAAVQTHSIPRAWLVSQRTCLPTKAFTHLCDLLVYNHMPHFLARHHAHSPLIHDLCGLSDFSHVSSRTLASYSRPVWSQRLLARIITFQRGDTTDQRRDVDSLLLRNDFCDC
jgi:hypothetical protein